MDKSIRKLIDEYMDSNKQLAEDLRQLTAKLSETSIKKSIVVFSHQMDINSVMNSNNHHLIEEMLENEKIFSEKFEKCLKRRLEMNDKKIWFCLQYKNLPENRNVKTFEKLTKNTLKLFSIDSLQIVSMSETSKSTIGRKYVSKTQNESQKIIKWKLKRINETKFKQMSEDFQEVKRKKTQKRVLLANIAQKDGKNCLNPFKITVFLETLNERQVQCLYNGSHLESVVLLTTESSEYVLLSFDKICRPIPQLIDNFNQYLLQFPESVGELFIDRKVSNYSFALSLAFIFGDNISIRGSFFRLKLGLLLSLLSFNEYPKKNHSSVLVICDDTLMIRRLFEWSSLLSQYRYYQKSLSVPMTGKSRDERQKCLNWIDAGVLQLGADGITIIGSVSNLNELPNKEKTALFHALETNEVIAQQSQPPDPSLSELELKSTIWAVIEDNIDEREYQQKNRNQTILWTEVFGMVYRIPKSKDVYIYSHSSTDVTLTLDQWRTVIELMERIRPRMTEMASKLLHDYYVCIRRIRGSKLNHISVQTLISLSKSMAKLSLRLIVTKYDALMAILLYEESLTTRWPKRESPLSVDPIFHVLSDQMFGFIGPNCDQMMIEFEDKLMQFLRKQTENSKPFSLKEYFSQNEE